QDEFLVHHDPLRITAQRVARRIGGRPVVGADHAALAVLLQSFVAGRAVLAAADHAADADHIAGLEAGHLAADGADAADDLVPRHAGIQRAAPLRARGVQV